MACRQQLFITYSFFLQLGKKRHVGNDVLCVVFTDQPETSFSPLWIKSQFLYAYILVQVLPASTDHRMKFKVLLLTAAIYSIYIIRRSNIDENGRVKIFFPVVYTNWFGIYNSDENDEGYSHQSILSLLILSTLLPFKIIHC
jgi:hypothetical protein